MLFSHLFAELMEKSSHIALPVPALTEAKLLCLGVGCHGKMNWCNYPQHTSNPPALGTAKIAAFLYKNDALMGPGLSRPFPVLLER